ncbi:MAG: hypothetical protein RL311_1093 [Bacteroidota bacterium]|jgi:hypothetical protein
MRILVSEEQYKILKEYQDVLDNILDKISAEGLDSLTHKEKTYLKQLEKTGQLGDLELPSENKKGFEIESDIEELPDMKFTFYEVNDTDIETEYYGEIEFMDRTFIGSVVTDPDGNITSVEFYDFKDNTDLMVFLEEMEPELMYFLNDVVEKLNQ